MVKENQHKHGYIKVFLLLWSLTALCIFLHELGHHLFGLPSMISFSRTWPLVPVTNDNKTTAIIGSLAGPAVNLLFSYIGLLAYKYQSKKSFKTLWMCFGLTNSFLALSAAFINLIVDLISGTRGNDLQVVSTLLGINILILPGIFILLSLWPIKLFWRDRKIIAPNGIIFSVMIFCAWLLGGLFLMLLDLILNIRFKLV